MTITPRYVHRLSAWPSYAGVGVSCYDYGPLQDERLEVLYVHVYQGHDTFQISEKVTRVYYIASGSGCFTIAGGRYDVCQAMIVEVPPKIEYSYSGNMELVIFSTPRWFRGNDQSTRPNPDVKDELAIRRSFRLAMWIADLHIMGKSPLRAFIRLHRRLWQALPASITGLRPLNSCVEFLERLTSTSKPTKKGITELH